MDSHPNPTDIRPSTLAFALAPRTRQNDPALETRATSAHDARTRFAFLAETSRLLAASLDFQSTLATAAGVALPHFGTWCIVDIVEMAGTISRVAVIHPDPAKQRAARDYYAAHPPHSDDPIGAARVIRTSESEFAMVASDDAIDDVPDDAHRDLLRTLGARSFLIVPMRARGRMLGAITFVSDGQRQYDDADLLLAEDLGRRCAMAIDNARLYGEAETAREQAAYAAQRADGLRGIAEAARDEANAANTAKASFLTRMSHEFRTPLGIILGYSSLLSEGVAGPVNDSQRQQLRRIDTAANHLLTLINEMLALAKINAQFGQAQLEDVDLVTLLDESCSLLVPMAHAKNLTLAVELPDAPFWFSTDPEKFRQIVFNLLANAVKYTKTGGIRVSLAGEPNEAVLRVADTGMGISPSDAERLFESFWQARGTDVAPGGSGLGLTIARQLAQLLGGDVELESSSDQGSTFLVRLPHNRRHSRPLH